MNLDDFLGAILFIAPGFISVGVSRWLHQMLAPFSEEVQSDRQRLTRMLVFSFLALILATGALSSPSAFKVSDLLDFTKNVSVTKLLEIVVWAIVLGGIWGIFHSKVLPDLYLSLAEHTNNLGLTAYSPTRVLLDFLGDTSTHWAEVYLDDGSVYDGYVDKFPTVPGDKDYVMTYVRYRPMISGELSPEWISHGSKDPVFLSGDRILAIHLRMDEHKHCLRGSRKVRLRRGEKFRNV